MGAFWVVQLQTLSLCKYRIHFAMVQRAEGQKEPVHGVIVESLDKTHFEDSTSQEDGVILNHDLSNSQKLVSHSWPAVGLGGLQGSAPRGAALGSGCPVHLQING